MELSEGDTPACLNRVARVMEQAGFLYLAIVLDVWSRRVVGWAMRTYLKTELVFEALIMALEQRGPDGVIHRSDHGCDYTAWAFGKRCEAAGVRPSMGSAGDAYDNAMAEAFFASLECELLDRRIFRSQAKARMAVFSCTGGWCNPRRRHSALGYLSPVDFEARNAPERIVPALAVAGLGAHPSPGGTTGLHSAAALRRLLTPSAETRDEAAVPHFSPVH